jgi:spermidine synthase
MKHRSTLKTLFAVIFVVSGACGLIYQIVWFKYLALFLGNTTYAQMIVLATFLGGLALGNHYFGRRADGSPNPARVYSSLELLIGVYCLLYPTLSNVLGDAFISAANNLRMDVPGIGFNAMRFMLSALLLIIPTVAMGGTLPLLSRFFVDDPRRSRGDTATLYFLNSFGAVIGIFLGGFFFIEAFGLDATIYITAGVNVLIGASGLYLSSFTPQHAAMGAGPELSGEDAGTPEPEQRVIVAVIAVAGISGVAALLYEMVWVRLLVNFFGSSTYSFSLMLMAFITGITVGSLLVSRRVFASVAKIPLLITCQLGIGVGTMLALMEFDRLPYDLWKLGGLFVKSESTFPIFLTTEFGICFLLMLLPTVFMGMALPLAVAIVSRSNNRIGRSVGVVFSLNTLGTVVGVVLTGLILIPVFGIQKTFEIGIAINFIAAFVLLFIRRNTPRYALALGVVALFLAHIVFVPEWSKNIMMSGVFRRLSQVPPKDFQTFQRMLSTRKVLYYKEGLNANVAILHHDGSQNSRALIVNGKPDASTPGDMPTQVLLGQIPMLYPNPKNVLVIGFGSGVTVGSVLSHPVEHVDCAEIAQEVVDGAYLFNDVNNDCLHDKRLRVTIEDAHTYLKVARTSYDVIVSEPSNPWIAGIGNLFSKEYFAQCKSRLNPGGIMVQWFQNYETTDDVVEMVVNTFLSVFPRAQLWTGDQNDLILVGADQEIPLDIGHLESTFRIPSVKKNLELIRVRNICTFLSSQTMTSEGLHAIADSRSVNSETHPLLEFMAPRAFYLQRASDLIRDSDERRNMLTRDLLVKQYLTRRSPSEEELYDTAEFFFSVSIHYRIAYGIAKHLVKDLHAGAPARFLLAQASQKLDINQPRTPFLREVLRISPQVSTALAQYTDDMLNEAIQSSTFLKTFPLDSIVAMIPQAQVQDTVAQVARLIRIADLYLRNSELRQADSVCKQIEPLVRRSDSLGNAVPLATFYQTSAATKLFLGDIQSAIDHLAPLILTKAESPDVRNIGRRIQWRLQLQEDTNKVGGAGKQSGHQPDE